MKKTIPPAISCQIATIITIAQLGTAADPENVIFLHYKLKNKKMKEESLIVKEHK